MVPKRLDVNELHVEFAILGLDDKLVSIDSIEIDSIQEKLTSIKNKPNSIIISTYDLLKVKLPEKQEIDKNTTKLEVGTEITYDELIEYMTELNYNSEKFVADPGSFAVRGSIIDFWSYSEEHPCRLEYDGDFLESIRYFDPESQRSSGRVEEVTLASSIESADINYSSDIFDYLNNPIVAASSYELYNLKKDKSEKTSKIVDLDDLDDDLKSELLDDEVKEKAAENKKIEFNENLSIEELFQKNAYWFIEDTLGNNDNKINLNILSPPVINSNFSLLFNTLRDYANQGIKCFYNSRK